MRFELVNAGALEHEFVLDTSANNQEHKAMMAQSAGMDHDDPNAARLGPGETRELIWTFANTGTFEFACLIPGHYQAGMHADVHVVDDAASTQGG